MPKRILRPIMKTFEEFFKLESASGILLLSCAALALIWANSPFADKYKEILNFHLTIGYGELALSKTLIHWINDGLMAIFFFLIGMEIKRELVAGELSSFKNAILPLGAAIGGMLLPASIYFFFNQGTSGVSGWGIPMATDIAFALGALALLGSDRAPKGLAVFLTALAIIDDLGAILVIAAFYTEQISWPAIAIALAVVAMLILANRLKFHYKPLFIILGLVLWLAFIKSGIHPTIAGVILGLTIPTRCAKGIGSPMLNQFEHALHPWVAYTIMPIFALANAGVAVEWGNFGEVLTHPVSLGIIFGLFFGKQLGIFGATWLMVNFKLAELPRKVSMYHIYGASLLSGIGFTMSLFITSLAFQDPVFLALAKISIIVASALAGIAGLTLLSMAKPTKVATRQRQDSH